MAGNDCNISRSCASLNPLLDSAQKKILGRDSLSSNDPFGGYRPFRHVKCHSETLASGALIARANPDHLRLIFEKYASKNTPEEKPIMTANDFIRRYLGLFSEENYNRESVRLLASAADTTKDDAISFEEFCAFEALLCSPDALYMTAFEIFDSNADDSITSDKFETVIRHTQTLHDMEFDFNSDFIKKYFGTCKTHAINYHAFTQLLHDFHEEQGIQAFKRYDTNGDGAIRSADFQNIMTTVKSHLLTDFVKSNLIHVGHGEATGHEVTYPYYAAFNSLLTKMELIKRVFVSQTRGNLDLQLSKEEFLAATQCYAQITPYEVEILFRLSELAHPGKHSLSLQDIELIEPERLKRVSHVERVIDIKAVESKGDRSFGTAIMESGYRFLLGSAAGACGAAAVYPIDLVKTRMQNQRTGSFVGEVMYKNSLDCFRKVIKFEGLLGLYRGLLPQIVGVAPEKALKLTMNDFVRDKFKTDGKIELWSEILAGGCAGSSQVVFTNPLEIVKIRLQVAGEIQTGPKVGVFNVLKELGFLGLYKGARACVLRDIPFSAIYFPTYAHAKLISADEDGINSPGSLFCSAFIAGVPAAGLVTPADVIKTRLQVAERAGQTTYNGIFDCAQKILKEEGPRAFWKGATARVCRSSPQFGVTLLTYEFLQRVFYVDFGGSRPTGSESATLKTITDGSSLNPDHIGGYRLAAATFSGIEHAFGLVLPRFETTKKPI